MPFSRCFLWLVFAAPIDRRTLRASSTSRDSFHRNQPVMNHPSGCSDHAPTFVVEVAVEGLDPAQGRGRSRQDAEKAAASTMLRREGQV